MKKVVVPTAGLGIRLLPTTKALPKEMLPLGKYPAIQLVVEELIASNLKELLFITSRNKNLLENQFDNSLHIEVRPEHSGQSQDLVNCDYRKCGIEFFYSPQWAHIGTHKPTGTGAAVAAARRFVDNEHFVVAYGDSVITSTRNPNFLGRMIRSHLNCNASCTVGVRNVPATLVGQYGIVQPVPGEDLDADGFLLKDIVEKPELANAPSQMAVNARYIFGPEIFDEIRKLSPGSDGEIGITDAIRGLIRCGHSVRAVPMKQDETRYDIGNHESYFKAFIDFARMDPDFGERIQQYMARCVSERQTHQQRSNENETLLANVY